MHYEWDHAHVQRTRLVRRMTVVALVTLLGAFVYSIVSMV